MSNKQFRPTSVHLPPEHQAMIEGLLALFKGQKTQSALLLEGLELLYAKHRVRVEIYLRETAAAREALESAQERARQAIAEVAP